MALRLAYDRDNPPQTENLVMKWGTQPNDTLYGYDVHKPIMRPLSVQKAYTIVGDHKLSALMKMSAQPSLAAFQRIADYRPAAFTTSLQAGPLSFSSRQACMANYNDDDLSRLMACDLAFRR